MPAFLFGQGSGPLGSGGVGPIPVLNDLGRRISPSDAPVPPTSSAQTPTGTGFGGITEALQTAGNSAGVRVASDGTVRQQAPALPIPVEQADP